MARRKPAAPIDAQFEYTTADIQRLFQLPAALVRALARAGFVTNVAPQGQTVFSVHDLLILRTAGALKAAKLQTQQILDAVGQLRKALAPGDLLTALALDARRPAGSWQTPAVAATAAPSVRSTLAAARAAAEELYAKGVALEESDLAAARKAYVDALRQHKHHLEARINLGRLLHLDGKLAEAEKVYRQAKHSSATLSYNLAILLEDLDREEEAIAAYRRALAQDPYFHDAHLNLSRLHERARQPREALRHLLAYRRHVSD